MCEKIGNNLIVVEGGLKGIKKFIRLMLHRINWDAVEAEENDDDEVEHENVDQIDIEQDVHKILKKSSGVVNRCDLLWQGLVARKSFHAFRFQECRTDLAAKKVLEAKNLSHYWDLVTRADEIIEANEM